MHWFFLCLNFQKSIGFTHVFIHYGGDVYEVPRALMVDEGTNLSYLCTIYVPRMEAQLLTVLIFACHTTWLVGLTFMQGPYALNMTIHAKRCSYELFVRGTTTSIIS